MKGVCRQYKVENAEFITVVLVKEDIMIDEKFAAFDTNDGKMVELSCTYDGNSIETSIYKLDCHLHDEDIEKHVNTVVRKELEKRLRKQGDFKGAAQSVIDEMLDRLCHELLVGEYGVKDNIICDYELESIRLCDQCGELMHKGYVVNGCEAFCRGITAKGRRKIFWLPVAMMTVKLTGHCGNNREKAGSSCLSLHVAARDL